MHASSSEQGAAHLAMAQKTSVTSGKLRLPTWSTGPSGASAVAGASRYPAGQAGRQAMVKAGRAGTGGRMRRGGGGGGALLKPGWKEGGAAGGYP